MTVRPWGAASAWTRFHARYEYGDRKSNRNCTVRLRAEPYPGRRMTLLAAVLLTGAASAESPLPVRAPAEELPIRGAEEFDLAAGQAWARHARMAKTGGRLVLTGGVVAAA